MTKKYEHKNPIVTYFRELETVIFQIYPVIGRSKKNNRSNNEGKDRYYNK